MAMAKESVSVPAVKPVVGNSTVLLFLLIVLMGGLNSVAIRLSHGDLQPLWGAGLRFISAGAIFWVIVAFQRIPLPHGRAIAGPLVFGLVMIGAAYAFIYLGLAQIPAGLGQVVMALVPMLTLLFAVAHGLEQFQVRRLIGALIALTGITIASVGEIGAGVTLLPVLSMLLGASCTAEGAVMLKKLPSSPPIVTNAIGMTAGGAVLLAASLLRGETWQLPAHSGAWLALFYLIIPGTVMTFFLVVTIIQRWSVSASAYTFVLFPLVTVIAAAPLAGEPITPIFLLGGALVLVGVWIGAFASPRGSLAAR